MFRFLPLVLLSLTFFALPSRAQVLPEPPRTISTSGESTVYVPPDEVIINLGVETFAPNLDDAKNENDQRAARLVKAVKDLGVDPKHLETAEMEIELRYRSGSHPIEGVEGYIARRAYAVTLKDVKRFEALIDAALKNGANRLMGFQYHNAQLRKHRDEARRMAVRAAREKASLLANELGCKLGMPRTITEQPPVFWSSRAAFSNSMMTQNSEQFAPDAAPDSPTMPLGQMAIRATVSVTFDLLPQ